MSRNITIAIVFGTRPEFIKLKELISLIQKSSLSDKVIVVNTGQHQDLLDNQIELSFIEINENLNIDRSNRDLSFLTGHCLLALSGVKKKYPNLQFLVGQGDTNTVLCLSLFCYLENLKFIHIEAGLRTNNLSDPFPEEFNRRIGTLVSYFNFAPTADAQKNLIEEGVSPSKIKICGNTGIDALINNVNYRSTKLKGNLPNSVIVTIHRRERSDKRVIQLARKLNELVCEKVLSKVTWVKHPNYSIQLEKQLETLSHIDYLLPLNFDDFVRLYETTDFVITDSGGVTEEAITFGICTIVFRNNSERFIPEAVKHRVLVSTNINEVEQHLKMNQNSARMKSNYYGDGNAAKRIFEWLDNEASINL